MIEDRENETFQITLYAKWETKHYKVSNFDVNKLHKVYTENPKT